uniref:Low affinity cation transporter n=1 Tax=Oryza sativa subsp. indica TaxID=39946 RepID=W8VTA3_ORYSI|nr:low affinity cation transporter [Oryza sativa Indica Group]
MTGEASKGRSGGGRASSSRQRTAVASELLELQQASSSAVSLPHPNSGDAEASPAVATPPAPAPHHDQDQDAEATSAAGRSKEKKEQVELDNANEQNVKKVQKDIEFGALVAGFSFSVAMTGFFLSPQATGRQAIYIDISMFLAFSSFVCGCSFMLLSMQRLSAREEHISGFHHAISKCLFYLCCVLPALTILCLLLVMPRKPYIYVGLGVLAAAVLPVAFMHWYVSRNTQETNDTAPEDVEQNAVSRKTHETNGTAPEDDDLQKAMESSYKITSAIVPMSLAGLVGVLFGVYKGGSSSGGAGGDISGSVHVVIVCMFITSMLSMLLMMLWMKVLESKKPKLREFFVRATIPRANAALLALLAIAAFAASFGILRWYMVAAFLTFALAATVQFVIQHCTREQNAVRASHNETQLKWMADMASKTTPWSLGIVMAIFGGFLGDDDKSKDKMVALKVCMFLSTSAFTSGLGLMYLTMRPGESARGGSSKAAMTILAWSVMMLLSAAALAIYGVEVMKS